MSQITWRNISNAGGQGTTIQGQANGVDTMLQGFNPLEQELQDRTALMNQNWDAKAGQNTREMRAGIQNIKSLADLNQMQDSGELSESGFDAKYGAQYDSGNLQGLINNQRDTLRNGLLGKLTQEASATADQEKDLAAGGAKLRELIQSAGGRTSFAQQASQDFMAGNQDRAKLYAQERKQEAEGYLGSTPAPTKPEDIENFVAQAQKAGIKDTDYIRSRLQEEMDNKYTYDKYRWSAAREGREATVFNQGQQDRQTMDTAVTTANNLMSEGLTAREAYSKVGGGVRGALQGTLLSTLTSQEIARSAMSGTQKQELLRVAQKSQNQLTRHQAALDAQDASFVKQREEVTGVTPTVLTVVDEAAKDGGGIVGKILSDIPDTGWEPSDLVSDIKTGKNRVEAALNNFRDQIAAKVSGASPREVDAILWLSYQDSEKISNWFSQKGINTKSLESTVEKQIEQFQKGEFIEQERLKFKKAADIENRELQEGHLDYVTATQKAVEKLNRTGKAGDVTQYIKDMEDKTLTVPEDDSFGVLHKLKLQRKAANDLAKKEQAKKAAEALAKRRQKQEQKPAEKPKQRPDSKFLQERIQQEMGTSWRQPEPDVTRVMFKKRPQN